MLERLFARKDLLGRTLDYGAKLVRPSWGPEHFPLLVAYQELDKYPSEAHARRQIMTGFIGYFHYRSQLPLGCHFERLNIDRGR